MMQGAWIAKTLVTEYLASDVPSRAIRFRNAWGYDDMRLPNPAIYIQYEPLALDKWPTIITLAMGVTGIEREDYDPDTSDPVYRVTYAMRTYVWVRDDSLELTTEKRDNLTTVIRDALVDHPALREVDRYESCYPYVDEGSIREEYSDLTLIKGERALAGAYISYDLNITETVDRDPLTTSPVLSYILTVEQMGHLPGAPTYCLATAGDTEVALTWKAPAWNGGRHSILGYRVEQSSDAGDTWAVVTADTGTTTPAYTVTSLTNGVTYQFRVSAFNEDGVGATSVSSNAVEPAT